jgi:hypothetical protein
MSRLCSVVDSNDCQASAEGLITGPVIACWGCGDDTCRECSSIVMYRWQGQQRRIRFCFNCQDTREIGRAEKKTA